MIGEFTAQIYYEDRLVEPSVEFKEFDEAPVNSSGGENDRSNCIAPSYGMFDSFAKRAELDPVLTELFNNIANSKERAVILTYDLLHRMKKAREKYDQPEILPDGSTNYDYKRLEWFCWWWEWALKNCKYPTMVIQP